VANTHLDHVLDQAAEAVEMFRREGKRVLLHCVAAQQRTPSVALRYAVRLGVDPQVAASDVLAALPDARGWGLLWQAAVGQSPRRAPAPAAVRSSSRISG
jgi:hypothetical protein